MRRLAFLLFALVVWAATPATAEAADYHCYLEATGYFGGQDGFYYQEFDSTGAVGVCQNALNNYAINLCSGQGDTGVFWIEYTVEEIWMGNWYYVDNGTVAWRCDDGWPVYA